MRESPASDSRIAQGRRDPGHRDQPTLPSPIKSEPATDPVAPGLAEFARRGSQWLIVFTYSGNSLVSRRDILVSSEIRNKLCMLEREPVRKDKKHNPTLTNGNAALLFYKHLI